MDDLLIISKRWGNRGEHNSVERFCALLDPEFEDKRGQRIHVPPKVSLFFKERTNSQRTPPYSAPYNSFSFELELWGLKAVLRLRPRYVFFPYADYDYFYFQYAKKILGLKVILWTFFSRQELNQRFDNLDHFASADLILVAGRDQMDYIYDLIPSAQVKYFPIGVDTDFFSPSPSFQPLRLVHVGYNRRDFKTLAAGLDKVYENHPNLQVDIIGVYDQACEVPSRPYFHIHPYLDDDRYLEVLQSANFALLSLCDGGSSNSLLEVIACGLPVVVTDLPNTRDYFDDAFVLRFQAGDAKVLANHCLELLANPTFRDKMGGAARAHSLQFSWHALSRQFRSLLALL